MKSFLRALGAVRFAGFIRFGGAAVVIGLSSAVMASDAHAQRRRSMSGLSRVDTTFAIARNGTVNVMATNGDIVITGWMKDQVSVRGASNQGGLRVQSSGSRIDIGAARGGDDTRLEISVPYGTKVIATSQSGDVSIRGTRGPVDVNAQSGDIRVEDVATRFAANSLSGDITASGINGQVAVETVSGDVNISDLRGDADIGTVSGEISMRGASSRIVQAKTTSGDVVYDGLIDPSGRYEFTAHSGDIRLHVQKDASAQISVSTWSGSIDSDFPMTLNPGEHGIGSSRAKGFTFAIGSGGSARIVAETFNGDINISANGHGPSTRRE